MFDITRSLSHDKLQFEEGLVCLMPHLQEQMLMRELVIPMVGISSIKHHVSFSIIIVALFNLNLRIIRNGILIYEYE
jgi:hypothetical protein